DARFSRSTKKRRLADFLFRNVVRRSLFAFGLRTAKRERRTANQRRTETELWLQQRISAFWKRRSANRATRTRRGVCAWLEKFLRLFMAPAKSRPRSRSIRGRCCAFSGRRAGTTRFSTWRSTAIG